MKFELHSPNCLSLNRYPTDRERGQATSLGDSRRSPDAGFVPEFSFTPPGTQIDAGTLPVVPNLWLLAIVETRQASLSIVDRVLWAFQSGDFEFAWRVGLIAWMLVLAWLTTEHYFNSLQPLPSDLRRFGEHFVQAFGRPLIQRRADAPPIKARLRYGPRFNGLEILIAPTDGRTYPNLSDHKSNVEYDVDRVLRLLKAEQFVSGVLHSEGQWVVIPIRRKQEAQGG